MCIIALAHRASARYPLIVAANRDESHARDTLRAGWWADAPIVGGRDAVAGGTWLAIGSDLRLAAVTNLRDPDAEPSPGAKSRGLLVSRFVSGRHAAEAFASSLAEAGGYAPYNLLLFDGAALHYAGNRAPARPLGPGVHALSNAVPGTEWPKVRRAREGLAAVLDQADPTDALFALLSEQGPPAGGFDERQVSLFLRHPVWGTRCSTVILVDRDGHVRFVERSFDAAGRQVDEVGIDFTAEPAAVPAAERAT
ncbi:MAG: NRDE family protein [Gammaproteobacteria bacterium]|nr:NRDE family protein [Gammaproteobacteria bacterium]